MSLVTQRLHFDLQQHLVPRRRFDMVLHRQHQLGKCAGGLNSDAAHILRCDQQQFSFDRLRAEKRHQLQRLCVQFFRRVLLVLNHQL